MVEDLEQQLGAISIPGVTSSRILRMLQNELGVNKRNDLNRITRRSGGDPALVAEGISSINRNTGRTFAGAALEADEVEDNQIQDSLSKRLSVALQREGQQNELNMMDAQAEYDQDREAYDFILNLLSSGANLGGSMYQANLLKRLFEEG